MGRLRRRLKRRLRSLPRPSSQRPLRTLPLPPLHSRRRCLFLGMAGTVRRTGRSRRTCWNPCPLMKSSRPVRKDDLTICWAVSKGKWSMAVSSFVPQVWAAELLVALEKSLVYGQPGVVNTDYEGEISQYGDTVSVNSVGDPTIGDYTAHSDISVEALDTTAATLKIDVAKYFAFEVDDI